MSKEATCFSLYPLPSLLCETRSKPLLNCGLHLVQDCDCTCFYEQMPVINSNKHGLYVPLLPGTGDTTEPLLRAFDCPWLLVNTVCTEALT